MPRKGARMSKAEMWSLLQTVADNVAVLSAQVDTVQAMVSSRNKAMVEHGAWGVKNTHILSTRVPNEIASRWEEVMLCENLSTSSVLRVLVEDFVDEYNPTEKGLFFEPRIPLSHDVLRKCSAEPSADGPTEKLISDIEQTLAFATAKVEDCF